MGVSFVASRNADRLQPQLVVDGLLAAVRIAVSKCICNRWDSAGMPRPAPSIRLPSTASVPLTSETKCWRRITPRPGMSSSIKDRCLRATAAIIASGGSEATVRRFRTPLNQEARDGSAGSECEVRPVAWRDRAEGKRPRATLLPETHRPGPRLVGLWADCYNGNLKGA